MQHPLNAVNFFNARLTLGIKKAEEKERELEEEEEAGLAFGKTWWTEKRK